MPDLPHTYTDINGTRLTVANGLLGLVAEGEGTIYTHTPTGEDAVAVARAVLAAAGGTGHEVARTEEIDSYRARVVELDSATRQLLQQRSDRRALPLIPDGDAPEPTAPPLCAARCPHGHDHSCARSPMHFGPHRDVKQKGDESCAWTEHDQAFRALDAVDARIIHRVARLETDLARRVADLEQQHADLARLVHGHGEDIGQAQAAIRGLGTYYTAEGDG